MSEAKAGIDRETVDQVANFGGENYKYGFTTDIDADKAPNGLNADIIRFISPKRTSRNGCSTGGWMRLNVGRPCRNPTGRMSITLKSIIRICAITRHQKHGRRAEKP